MTRSYEDDDQYQPDPELEAVMDDDPGEPYPSSIEDDDRELDRWADEMAARYYGDSDD